MSKRPRVRIEGDHSDYHCGSAAVIDCLTKSISCWGELARENEEFDVLVVNGEGSMHHGWKNFHRKMTLLREAQILGKRTYLINSLWQENPSDYDDVLMKLDGISVRGPISGKDLYSRHGIQAHESMDLCYFAGLSDVPPMVDYNGACVITDVFSHSLGGFVWPSAEHLSSIPRADLRSTDWSQFIANVKTASVFVTGRHHGMFAACKARVPFVLFEGNSHKMDDLLASYGRLTPPKCTKFGQVTKAADQAHKMRAEFTEFFEWMDHQRPWVPIPC